MAYEDLHKLTIRLPKAVVINVTVTGGTAGSECMDATGVQRRQDAKKQPAEDRRRNGKRQHVTIQN